MLKCGYQAIYINGAHSIASEWKRVAESGQVRSTGMKLFTMPLKSSRAGQKSDTATWQGQPDVDEHGDLTRTWRNGHGGLTLTNTVIWLWRGWRPDADEHGDLTRTRWYDADWYGGLTLTNTVIWHWRTPRFSKRWSNFYVPGVLLGYLKDTFWRTHTHTHTYTRTHTHSKRQFICNHFVLARTFALSPWEKAGTVSDNTSTTTTTITKSATTKTFVAPSQG